MQQWSVCNENASFSRDRLLFRDQSAFFLLLFFEPTFLYPLPLRHIHTYIIIILFYISFFFIILSFIIRNYMEKKLVQGEVFEGIFGLIWFDDKSKNEHPFLVLYLPPPLFFSFI
ncbi:hypothetical protein BDA99DRAFT_507558 [Phascolomyces articulosus]|uniref:Transmembrane protein n=1 Tax=Phascolomyces articulosus TaxID=60185 RepID=A0AAD5KB74_9FUNG|nr:hypothetical protein BDA99DRAFT_507558 [Phascolomyces articulosus]